MAAIVSMKQPTMSRKTLTSSRMIHGSSVMERTSAETLSVTFVSVIRYPKMEAPATISRMMAVVSAVSMLTLISFLNDSVR